MRNPHVPGTSLARKASGRGAGQYTRYGQAPPAQHSAASGVRRRRSPAPPGGAAAAAYRIVRRKPRPSQDETDPRDEELRRRLDESHSMVEEQEEFEAAETPVDR